MKDCKGVEVVAGCKVVEDCKFAEGCKVVEDGKVVEKVDRPVIKRAAAGAEDAMRGRMLEFTTALITTST